MMAMDTTLLGDATNGDSPVTPSPAPEPPDTSTPPDPTTAAAASPKWLQRTAAFVAIALLSGGTAAVATHALDGRGATTTSFGTNFGQSASRSAARSLALSGTKLNVAGVVAKVGPSVVSIRSTITTARNPFFGGGGTEEAAGTGVIISSDGEIMTNAHVIDGASTVKVTLAGESQARTASVIGEDTAADLALLKISNVKGLPAAALGKSSDIAVGDDVVAIGNALALRGGPTVTRGIISALDRSLESGTSTMTGLIQTDASISSGNSGGPLVDATGKVIGINSAVAASGQGSQAENIGFAIAIDNALPVLDRLRNHTRAAAAGYLGVRSSDPSDGSRGATVRSVDAGSAAARAGIQTGDLITAVDGKSVDGAAALGAAIRAHTPGSPVKITLIRNGNERTVTADLSQRPAA